MLTREKQCWGVEATPHRMALVHALALVSEGRHGCFLHASYGKTPRVRTAEDPLRPSGKYAHKLTSCLGKLDWISSQDIRVLCSHVDNVHHCRLGALLDLHARKQDVANHAGSWA